MDIKIKAAKLKGDKLEVEYIKTGTDNSHSVISESRDTKVHPDLKTAFQKLAVHLALIPEMITVANSKNSETLKVYNPTAYSIGGKEDNPGVTLTGFKLLKSGKAFNYNTPFQPFDQEEKSAYCFLDMLQEDIDACDVEVLSYLDGSKKAPEPQLSLLDQIAEEKSNGKEQHDEVPGEDEEDQRSQEKTTKKFRKKKSKAE